MSAVPTASLAPPATGSILPARRHFYWIDWLRFLAAFFVLLDHACQVNWSGHDVAVDPQLKTTLQLLVSPIHLGREAVIVFFVLSGALVGNLTWEKVRAGTFDATAYAADRLARIYVPLIPALLLTLAVMQVYDLRIFPFKYVACLFGLQDVVTLTPRINSVLWTLAYEMWFYVLAVCVGVLAGWRSRPRLVWIAALAGGALSLWILCFQLDWINLVCWLVGVFGFGLRHRLKPAARVWAVTAGPVLMVASVLCLWRDFLPLAPGGWTADNDWWRTALAHLTLSTGALLLIVGSCLGAPATRLGARVEQFGTPLAAFSYTLYLTHFPLLLALLWSNEELPEIVTWYSLFRLIWWMAFCVVAALIMYALFERQTPRARRWLRTLLSGKAGSRPEPAVTASQPTLAAGTT